MTLIRKSIHEMENKFEQKEEWFAYHHPWVTFVAAFIGMPIFILLAVSISTVSIAVPLSILFGWM